MLYHVEYVKDSLEIGHCIYHTIWLLLFLLSDSCSNRSDFCGTGTWQACRWQGCIPIMQICRQDMHPSCLASPTQWAPYQASLELHSPELSSTAPEIGESFDLTKRAASSNATEGEAYDNLLAPDYMKLSLGIVSNSWSALQPSETSATCHQSESYLCRNLALFCPSSLLLPDWDCSLCTLWQCGGTRIHRYISLPVSRQPLFLSHCCTSRTGNWQS